MRASSGASSDAGRTGSWGGGYNSSCEMVEPLFRAINTGQLSSVNR
jgi:hypothetical protein